MPAPPPRRSRVPLGLAAAFALLTGLVMSGSTAGLDEAVSLWTQRTVPPSLHDFLVAASVPVDGWNGFYWGGALILLALLAAGGRGALFVIVFGIGAILLNTTAKAVFDRPRPAAPIDVMVAQPGTASFPSGHVVFVAGLVGAAVFVLVLGRGGLVRRLSRNLLLAAVALMALSRVYLGQHFLTDTIGGALVGLAVVTAGAAWVRGRGDGEAGVPETEPEA